MIPFTGLPSFFKFRKYSLESWFLQTFLLDHKLASEPKGYVTPVEEFSTESVDKVRDKSGISLMRSGFC